MCYGYFSRSREWYRSPRIAYLQKGINKVVRKLRINKRSKLDQIYEKIHALQIQRIKILDDAFNYGHKVGIKDIDVTENNLTINRPMHINRGSYLSPANKMGHNQSIGPGNKQDRYNKLLNAANTLAKSVESWGDEWSYYEVKRYRHTVFKLDK